MRASLPLVMLAAGAAVLGGCASGRTAPPAPQAALKPCWQRPMPAADSPVIPDLGCATEQNLQAMLVDPNDRGAGREAAAPSGDAALAAVRRYRQGAVKGLPAAEPAAAPGLVLHEDGGK